MEKDYAQPFLTITNDPYCNYLCTNSSSTADEKGIRPVNRIRDLMGEFLVESKKLWYLAGPAIFTSTCQYSLGSVTQAFAGHLGTIDLAAFSIENSCIAGFSYGILWGMSSAAETLCGQAFGAGQIEMLGVYMQRSWVVLNATAMVLVFLYIYASRVLAFIGQTAEISEAAGTLAVWMIPQLFAYAANFPLAKFLQSQGRIVAMAVIAAAAVILHAFFNWLLILKLGWGLAGAAVVLNGSWWFVVAAQLCYLFSGACGPAWSGFSLRAFHNVRQFVRLSLQSAVMLCLESWYFMALIVLAGYLKNAEVAVDASSICNNVLGWTMMAASGLSAAISVRVSNELGAANPRAAKFSAVMVGVSSFAIGIFLALILAVARRQYAALFTNSTEVKELVYELAPFLALCIATACVQLTLSGVAIGAGWQAVIAYVNVGCYYLIGIPLGILLAYKFDMGVKGIWFGVFFGAAVQTCVMCFIIYKTNWKKEASAAEDRLRKCRGGVDANDLLL